MRILTFTPTMDREDYLRQWLLGLMVQTLPPTTVALSLGFKVGMPLSAEVPQVISDLASHLPFQLVVGARENLDQHRNFAHVLRLPADWREYDLYVKIDDDDLYLKEYLEITAKWFKAHPECHFSLEEKTPWIVKGVRQPECFWHDNPNIPGTPSGNGNTIAFTRKFLDLLVAHPTPLAHYEDASWHKLAEKHGLVVTRPMSGQAIYNRHGRNISGLKRKEGSR